MAHQVLGRKPHRPEDASLHQILAKAPARIDATYIARLSPAVRKSIGYYGLRMTVLAMRERSIDRLREGLLAMALGAVTQVVVDERDVMVNLALPHVAAVELGVQPADLFNATAARLDDGRLASLLRAFGGRTDVTPAAFGWRQIMTSEGLDVIVT